MKDRAWDCFVVFQMILIAIVALIVIVGNVIVLAE